MGRKRMEENKMIQVRSRFRYSSVSPLAGLALTNVPKIKAHLGVLPRKVSIGDQLVSPISGNVYIVRDGTVCVDLWGVERYYSAELELIAPTNPKAKYMAQKDREAVMFYTLYDSWKFVPRFNYIPGKSDLVTTYYNLPYWAGKLS